MLGNQVGWWGVGVGGMWSLSHPSYVCWGLDVCCRCRLPLPRASIIAFVYLALLSMMPSILGPTLTSGDAQNKLKSSVGC